MIHHTVNETTVNLNQCTATVIADSLNSVGKRLTTLELVYPRYIHCFDEKTEILARIGEDCAPEFMPFSKAVALNAQVAQYEPTTEKISFVTPDAWIQKKGCHDMVEFVNNKLSMCVTTEHRMLVDKRTSGNAFVPETWKAKKFLENYIACRIRQSGYCEDGQYYSKEEIALMVWFASDGTINGNYAYFHFRKQRKIDAVESLLKVVGIEYKKRIYNNEVVIGFLPPAWIQDCYTDDTHEKKIPDRAMYMDNDTYSFVKSAILNSDGNEANEDFNNTSRVFAEQVQILAHLHGDAMNLRYYKSSSDNGKRLYKSCFKNSNYISLRRDKDKFTSLTLKGTVYCVSVPSTYVVVRRDGIVHVSGNCELLTHRVCSRNASSSRATPVNVLVSEVMNDPVFFSFVGKNQSGMVAGDKLTDEELQGFEKEWKDLAKYVGEWVLRMNDKYNIHKQTLNRALEPFTRIRTLVTATEWDNFFKLRISKDAQPEMQDLAKSIKFAMTKSIPEERELHLPYVDGEYRCFSQEDAIAISVARCARVSYARLNGKDTSYADDFKLYQKLLECGHLSPFEHVAFAKGNLWQYKNLIGWDALRNKVE